MTAGEPVSGAEQLAVVETALDEDRPLEAQLQAETILSSGGLEQAEALRFAILARGRAAEVRRQKPREAEALAEEWIARARSAGEKLFEAAALLGSAELAASAYGAGAGRRLGKAERQARQALGLLAAVGGGSGSAEAAQRLKAAALRCVAAARAEDWDAEGATAAANEAHDLAQSIGDERAEALGLRALAAAKAAEDPPAFEEALKLEASAWALLRTLGRRRLEAQSLCQAVFWSLELGRPKDALKYAIEAYSARNCAEETPTYLLALAASGQGLKALQVAKDCVLRAKKGTDRLEVLFALEILAREYLRQGNFEQALATFREACGVAKQLGLRTLEFSVLYELAQLQMQRQMWTKAATSLRDAAAVSSVAAERAQAWHALAEVQVEQADFDTAVETAGLARAGFQEARDARGEASAVLVACSAHSKLGESDKALSSARLAFELAFVGGHLDVAARAQKKIAEMHLAQQLPDEAFIAASEAVKLWQEVGDASGLSEGLRMAATLGLRRGDLQDSLDLANQALELAASVGDGVGQAHSQVLLAQLHAKLYEREDKSAVAPAKSPSLASMREAAGAAQAMAAQSRDRHLQAVASHWYAQALMMSHRPPPEDALRFARKAQALFREVGEGSGEALASTLVAYLLLPKGEYEQAAQNAQRSLALAQQCGDTAAEKGAREAAAVVERVRVEKASGGRRGAGGAAARGGRPAPGKQPAAPETFTAAIASVAAPAAPSKPKLDPVAVRDKLLDMARGVIGGDLEVHAEHALMDVGMDSLASIDFTNQVSQLFSLQGASSLVFDYPTVAQIVGQIMEA
mmetsp:Transcript_80548/g.260965  ORF Transcript_80548/g.260965 Transcript_80548/m.260965 type:complete len:811 (-) Transcript_80548:41-2473(-)|eukprot:CAMPEP_0203914778 /NCGR_PEP_ID=MMETSP0359-20131031/55637_1 /ASSEMBLY_ACC=CAM_ASM_000338 /TAXON_ID=268821 /ORGANISM="Scrippsiella Hangoei, Strain SHTV-5" /LENGTH=810 /DNA_ID=CAMNT_0050841151 /DNA_START=54 /DNA_END=2486 /DNA_ORIENTATION=-